MTAGTEMSHDVLLCRMKGICHWTLTSNEPEVLVIEDLKEDARSRDHPIVTGEPFVRYVLAPTVPQPPQMSRGYLICYS